MGSWAQRTQAPSASQLRGDRAGYYDATLRRYTMQPLGLRLLYIRGSQCDKRVGGDGTECYVL